MAFFCLSNATRALFPLTLVGLVAGLTTQGCSDDAENQSGTQPAATTDGGVSAEASAVSDGGGGADVVTTTDGGFALKAFTAPPATPGNGSVLFTISGEALATEGFAFPPAVDQEVTFVDGWEVKLERLITTVDALTLSEAPDTDPADQAKTGKVVAEVDGPFAVDLAKDDPTYPAGKGGEGKAVPLAVVANQNKNGGAAFDTAGARYAFGFKSVAATPNAQNVNLGPQGLADYADMVKEGCSILYVGTGTFKGTAGGVTCAPAPGANAALDALPSVVNFKLCVKAPVDSANCQNPDNDPAAPLGGEDHQRGVAIKSNTFVTAQATVHPDHLFWISVEEDAPATFNQFAAAAQGGGDGGTGTVTMKDLEALDYQALKNKGGAALPWRNCVGGDFTPPVGNMSFNSGAVLNVGPTGNPATGLRHTADFVTFITSTQGHLNADGLCAVKRNYSSPN